MARTVDRRFDSPSLPPKPFSGSEPTLDTASRYNSTGSNLISPGGKMDPNSIPWYVWFLSGLLVGVGTLIAMRDSLSQRITAQDNLGVVLLAAGIILLIGWFVIPFYPVIRDAIVLMWERSTTTMLIAFAVGVILTVIGVILWRRH